MSQPGQGRDRQELLRVEGLSKFFPVSAGIFGKTVGQVRAVDDLSFTIYRGETLGLVGESGCGKTTAGRSLLRLLEPTSGRVIFNGVDITALSQSKMRRYRRRMQIVFQDPFGSLNPRKRVLQLVGEAIEQHGLATGEEIEQRVAELLEQVGLPASWIHRYPHEFSGGQRQRIGVARALALSPDLIVCDEAVSALDVSIQAQVLNLFIELQKKLNLAYLFIAHDLSVVRHISDRVAVMYLGKLVEISPCADIFEWPAHPYTRALLSAIPRPDPTHRTTRIVLQGDVPTPLNPPSGCHFHTRCPNVMDRCSEEAPPLQALPSERQVRCFHAEGLSGRNDWYDVLETRLRKHSIPQSNKRRSSTSAYQAASGSTKRAGAPEHGILPPTKQDESSGRALSGLLLLSGCAVLAAGSFLWAMGLLGLGLLLGQWFARSATTGGTHLSNRVKRRWVWAGVVVALLVSRVTLPLRRADTAIAQLQRLQLELDAYSANTGHPPQTLLNIHWRTVAHFGAAIPLDPWGHPYRYQPRTRTGPMRLSSLGADGRVSSDDISLP